MITHEIDLSRVWPEVSRRLAGYLRSRGAAREDVEDAVQECALRLLSSPPAWSSADDLLPWCMTVARNHLVDLARKRARLVEDVPEDVAASVDVHAEVAARLSLRAVVGAWTQLSARDRESLAEAASGAAPVAAPTRKEAVRLNVARHRARQRLSALVAASLGVLVAAGRALRPRVLPAVTTAALASTVLLVLPLVTAPFATERAEPSTRLAPATAAARAGTALAVPTRQVASRGAAPRPGSQVLTPAAAPVARVAPAPGTSVTLTEHPDDSPGPLGSVCVGGLVVVHDLCLDSSPADGRTRPVPASAHVVLRVG